MAPDGPAFDRWLTTPPAPADAARADLTCRRLWRFVRVDVLGWIVQRVRPAAGTRRHMSKKVLDVRREEAHGTHVTTTPKTYLPTEEDDYADAIDCIVSAGFDPTDDAPVSWLDRWDAFVPLADDAGWVTASVTDGGIDLYVLTPTGVVRSEARFDHTDLGRRMFTAAAMAVTA